jgi:hypothetical protein
VPAGWADRVRAFGVAQDTDTTVLVRPDEYVAWAGDKADPATLTLALTAWCGTPSDTRDLAQ